MPRFIEGQDRRQVTLVPECLDDFIGDDNPVRALLLSLQEAGAHRSAPGALRRDLRSHRPVRPRTARGSDT